MADEKTKKAAEKKEAKTKAATGEERVITINLREILTRKPHWRRTKDAANILRRLLEKKTRADKIVIGKGLNEKLWSRGIQKPATKLRVKVIKESDIIRAELME